MEKRQCIEMVINDEMLDGVFAISLVDKPAIEENFIKLAYEKILLKVVDEERRIVVGFALVPEKKILRRADDGTEYDIKFSKETVQLTAELFMKNQKGNEFTLEHEDNTNGVNVIESWIVEDPKNDKSNIYNLGAKGGEWCLMSKIDNQKVWDEIKLGTYNGYSIEGKFFSNKEALKEVEIVDEDLEALKKFLNTII